MRQKRKNREGKWGKNALFNFPEPGKILDYTCWLEMKHFSFLPWIEKHWGFFNCQFEELQRVFCGKYVKEPSNFILHISVFQHNISVKIAKSFKRNWLERILKYGWMYISPYLHEKFNFKALVCMDFQFWPQLLAYKVKKYDWNRKCSKWICKNNKCTFFKGGSFKLLIKMFGGIFIFVTLQKKSLKSRGKSL